MLRTFLSDGTFPQTCGAAKTFQLVQDISQMVTCADFDNTDDEFKLACDMRKLNTHGNIDVDQFSCFGMECADLLKLIMDLVHMNAVMHRKI